MKNCQTVLFVAAFSMPSLADPIDDLKPGQWYEIPDSKQESVKPGANQFPGTNIQFFSCGMDCWVSGAYDTKRDRLVFGGGGHGSYWGNELYAFSLGALKWQRLNDPSLPLENGIFGMCPVDRNVPAATHTYEGVEYIPPPIDRFIYNDNERNRRIFAFDQDGLKWEPKAPSGYVMIMAWDPASGLLFYHENFGSELKSWDPVTNATKGYGKSDYLDYSYSATVDPKRRKVVAIGGKGWAGQTALVWDISKLQATSIPAASLATTGDKEIESVSGPGLEYDPVSDKIVAWSNGTAVYTLDMDTRVWTRVAPSQANTVSPTARNGNGTFGRFRYIPSRNVYILANRSSDNVFIYRLTAPTTATSALPLPGAFSVSIFPNPVRSALQVRIEDDKGTQGAEFWVYDLRGYRMAAAKKGSLNTTGWAAGVYTLVARSGKFTFSKKLVVQ